MNRTQTNPRVSYLLLGMMAIAVLVLLVAGGGLFFLPTVLRAVWPWTLTPFNTAFLGAVYLASMTAAALLVFIGRWSPARVVVPMILAFTAIALVVSLVYSDRFDWRSPSTWLWFALYIVIPLHAAYYLWRYRALPSGDPWPLRSWWRTILLAQAVLLGAYGVGLLVAGARFAAFWPWPVDEFHARLYSVAFITPALGALLVARAASRADLLALALAQLAGGAFAITGIIVVDASAHRVVWRAGGSVVWLAIFALLLVSGMGLLWEARRHYGAMPAPTARGA